MKSSKLLTQLPVKLEHEAECMCNQSFTLDDIYNTWTFVRKSIDIGKCTLYKGNSLRGKKPFRVENKYKPMERVEEVTNKKKSCHNCRSTDHYPNSFPNVKKKVYAIKQVPEEEIQAEDS
ncbi:hypothetical protein O181_132823 [Austropuccinia psidii MF-1]|uniref:Uncharacterized protein n=1 Tax=Austropuccinia psidii MF-1 TaxID=1389203 RepID=A0A9Q3L4J4_9BASI|nr:hypothetical protein [Austropuccinia psidii MF-1]